MPRSSFLPWAVALVLTASTAVAEPRQADAPRATLTDSLRGTARAAFDSAQILLHNEDYSGAMLKYEQAHDESHDPRLLFNMALCARGLKAYARMRALLVRYERESGAALPVTERADVDAALAAIRDLVGMLVVTVNEPGATVDLDGKEAATTPMAQPVALDLGEHAVKVHKSGFTPIERTIRVQGGGKVELTLALEAAPHTGRLRVSTDEAATVFVDGIVAARGPFDGAMPPGLHEVRVTGPGKVRYDAKVDLRDGETRVLEVTLSDEAHHTVWPWIAGGAAVVAAGVVGGYFLFRPQAQGSGAPPTGQLGSVSLASWRP
jgi:hypothetical protein